ncbi:PHP domain-containing protein, partial [Faecalibaculum rodentium]
MLHLHTRSCCSFLESPLRPEQIVQCARNAGMTAAAITDHDAMYGVMEFYHACRNADMKPVFGLETEIQGVRLLVLAKDDQGLQTLYAWNSRIMEDRVNPPVSRENQPAENE